MGQFAALAIGASSSATIEERVARAKKGATARWGERTPKATHKGSLLDEFGFDVDCYVLDDEHKTAVIHQRGMGAALGFSPQGGGRLQRFISGKNIAPYLGLQIREKLENPIVFQGLDTVSGDPTVTFAVNEWCPPLRERWRAPGGM